MTARTNDPYIVKSLVHASKILEAFDPPGDVLRLRDIVERTGYGKGMCFRLLHTLHQCGFIDKIDERHYRLVIQIRPHRRFRIGKVDVASSGRWFGRVGPRLSHGVSP